MHEQLGNEGASGHSSLVLELRRIASRHLRRERPDHTLQPTALANEAWIILQKQNRLTPADRAHYLAAAAVTIRRILIDHAKRRCRLKRGEDKVRHISLHAPGVDVANKSAPDPIDVLDLEEALELLEKTHARAGRVVVLRFYGGLTLSEIAEELRVSKRTAADDWAFARAWLLRKLDTST